MRRISERDALAECLPCGSSNTRRTFTSFSSPRVTRLQGESPSGGHNSGDIPSEPGPHFVDCLFENNWRAAELHSGNWQFAQSKFKGNQDGIVLKGDATASTKGCDFE